MIEHQFDDIIDQLIAQGWTHKKIAAQINRSRTYVDVRASIRGGGGIKDPLGPLAFDPGRPPPVITKRFFPSHKPGGW